MTMMVTRRPRRAAQTVASRPRQTCPPPPCRPPLLRHLRLWCSGPPDRPGGNVIHRSHRQGWHRCPRYRAVVPPRRRRRSIHPAAHRRARRRPRWWPRQRPRPPVLPPGPAECHLERAPVAPRCRRQRRPTATAAAVRPLPTRSPSTRPLPSTARASRGRPPPGGGRRPPTAYLRRRWQPGHPNPLRVAVRGVEWQQLLPPRRKIAWRRGRAGGGGPTRPRWRRRPADGGRRTHQLWQRWRTLRVTVATAVVAAACRLTAAAVAARRPTPPKGPVASAGSGTVRWSPRRATAAGARTAGEFVLLGAAGR